MDMKLEKGDKVKIVTYYKQFEWRKYFPDLCYFKNRRTRNRRCKSYFR